jgi:hypothetical protein
VVIAVTDEEPVTDAAPVLVAAAADAPLPEPETPPTPAAKERRRSWGRIALWVVPIVLVLGVAVGAVGWYARKDYFVALDRGRVTVFKGVPGGVFMWNPTVERATTLTADDLRPADRSRVRDEPTFSSLDDANAYVARLRARSTT